MVSSRSVAVSVRRLPLRLAQKVREDRNGRLALDDALRQLSSWRRSYFFTLNSIVGLPPLDLR